MDKTHCQLLNSFIADCWPAISATLPHGAPSCYAVVSFSLNMSMPIQFNGKTIFCRVVSTDLDIVLSTMKNFFCTSNKIS
jgi:hypothetical protein